MLDLAQLKSLRVTFHTLYCLYFFYALKIYVRIRDNENPPEANLRRIKILSDSLTIKKYFKPLSQDKQNFLKRTSK